MYNCARLSTGSKAFTVAQALLQTLFGVQAVYPQAFRISGPALNAWRLCLPSMHLVCGVRYMAIFGSGHDLYLQADGVVFCNIGDSYELRPGLDGKTFFSGCQQSRAAEIEVIALCVH